jgi:hypothetical protein
MHKTSAFIASIQSILLNTVIPDLMGGTQWHSWLRRYGAKVVGLNPDEVIVFFLILPTALQSWD